MRVYDNRCISSILTVYTRPILIALARSEGGASSEEMSITIVGQSCGTDQI